MPSYNTKHLKVNLTLEERKLIDKAKAKYNIYSDKEFLIALAKRALLS